MSGTAARQRRLGRRALLRALGGGLALAGLGLVAGGCGSAPLGTERARPRQLVIATGATGGVYYPYGSGIAKLASEHLRNVQSSAEITAASVDNLRLLRDGKANLAFTQADTLFDAVKGQGAFATGGRVPVMAVAALYVDYAHVVTLAERGVRTLADLRGRTVALGPEGSGTEIVARRLLDAVGLHPLADVQARNLAIGPAVAALRAGEIDAFVWLGGLPTTAVLDLATTPGVQLHLVPTADALPALQARFGASLYQATTVPRGAYPGLAAEVPSFGVANLLVAHEELPETLVHRLAQVLFERRGELAALHLEARQLAPASAVVGSPAPFHAGAMRLYRELGVWPT